MEVFEILEYFTYTWNTAFMLLSWWMRYQLSWHNGSGYRHNGTLLPTINFEYLSWIAAIGIKSSVKELFNLIWRGNCHVNGLGNEEWEGNPKFSRMIWSRARGLHKSGSHPPPWYLASRKSLRLTDIVNPMLVELSSCYLFFSRKSLLLFRSLWSCYQRVPYWS